MAKVIIKYKISSKKENVIKDKTKGIKKDNIITYKEDETIVSILLEKGIISIERENDKMHLNLKFEENKSYVTDYLIKDLGFNFKVDTRTKKLMISENKISVLYELYINGEYSDSFNFNLEWRDL